jgi:anti-sigma B factor antagonist
MSKSVECELADLDDGKLVTAVGDVDFSCSSELRRAIQEALVGNPQRLVIDLKGVNYMDSSGVATLVEALQIQTKAKKLLVLCNLQKRVQGIFEIARLTTVFTITDDVESAKIK